MKVLLISSPGAGPGLHWSHAAASALQEALLAAGAQAHWFAVVDAADAPRRPAVGGFTPLAVPRHALHRVTAGTEHLELEVELTRVLRRNPADAVVHLGVGARGSVNVSWLADRMGSAPFAVARASEVVCQRGDLIDARAQPCSIFEDADRCRACCAASWLRRPRSDEFRNRLDLLVVGLQVCSAVFVETEPEAAMLERIGLPRRVLHAAPLDASSIAARILARRATVSS
jgi:hypothetical protein